MDLLEPQQQPKVKDSSKNSVITPQREIRPASAAKEANASAAKENKAAGQEQVAETAGMVAERPQLAPDVELSGEMQESGFEEKQWLAIRSGKFIQLTELLYLVAEEATGQQTLEEMAAKVSAKYNKKVSAANIRQLLEKKLIPMGLVTKADGTVEGEETEGASGRGHTHGRTAGRASGSPLQVNLKMAKVPPKFIEPGTAVFQHFYHLYVLLPIIIIAILAHLWLFLMHGVAHATSELLYNPGLMLGLLGLIIVSAAFHEFGHAAALKFAGGKVRGMGVGLYIIYPAFYTDVTDNYRLKRWARVRTDLGGFYFNLIFMLAIMGIYAATGWEFLLAAIVLMDLEIFHQLLPFVRLDGYWALADITGIPDFFSQIGPFLRTVLPLPFWKGRKLPNLKPWVKVVFALYILVTIPLLVFLIFLMVTGLPRILATAWDSFFKQGEIFAGAVGKGDILTMLGSGGQILLLAIPVGGTLFVLFSLARTGIRLLWNWSKPTPARRVAGSLIAVGVLGLLAYLWTPQLPFARENTPGPLYQTASRYFVPIRPTDRGVIYEAVPFIAEPPNPNPDTTPTAIPGTFTPAPSVSPSVTVTGSPLAGTPGLTTTPTITTTITAGTTLTPAASIDITATASALLTPVATVVPTAIIPTLAPVLPTATSVPLSGGSLPVPVPTATPAPAPTSTPVPTTVPPTATPAPTPSPTFGGVITTQATPVAFPVTGQADTGAGTGTGADSPTPTP